MNSCRGAVAALFLTLAVANGQVSGRLSGTVVDPSGANVPDARVELLLQGGSTPLLTTTTNSEGIFDFVGIRPTLYQLVIEKAGFAKFAADEVKVDPAREVQLPPIKLQLAAASQTVEITESANAVNIATAEISTTVTQTQITNIPVLNRSIVNLFNTQAGVTQNNRQATVINGMRPSFSNIYMDGILVQDSVRTNDLDLTPNRFTIAQVAEFTVSTTNASPTLGGGSSTIVLTTPSGTDEFHGSVYWYNRNNYFAANNWFNNQNVVARPFLNLNEPGATLGGPIKKDKLFFFGAYEAYRLKRQTPLNRTIPTTTARQGILQYRLADGTVQQFDVLKAQGVAPSPLVAKYLSQIPATGNNAAIGDGLNTTGYTFNAQNNITRDNVSSRGDYYLNSKNSFSGTFSWNRDVTDRNDGNGSSTGGYYTVVPPTLNDNHSKLVSLAWRWNPAPTLTNELRGGFNFSYVPFVVRSTLPDTILNGFFFTSPIQTAELGEGRNLHQYNIADNAQWVHGKHTFSFGFQMSNLRVYSWNYNGSASTNAVIPIYSIGISSASPYGFSLGSIPGASSTYINTANSILASIGGLVSSTGQYFNVTSRTSGFVSGAPSIQHQVWPQYSFYGSDNFRLRRNLTLTLGLRWDIFLPVEETDGLAAAPVPVGNNGPATLLGNATIDFAGTSQHPFYKKDLNNFAPNVSLAWSPFTDGKTSIRGGFSIAYVNDNNLNSTYNTVTPNNGLNTAIQANNLVATADNAPRIAAPTFAFPTTTLDQFKLQPSSPPVEGLVNPDLATPYVEQWVVSIQHELKGWTLEGRYVGNHGVKLFRGVDLNQVNINQGDFLADFKRARNNGFAAATAGLAFSPAYNPNVPGSQPLDFLNKLPSTVLTNSTLIGNIRTGEVGTYAQNIQSLFPYPQLGFSFFPNPYLLYALEMTNLSTANYNGLQLEVTKRMHSGFQFQANYTYSKALTDANALRGLDPQLDNASPTVERARADFDLTHVFKLNYYAPLPIGKGHALHSNNAIAKRVIDGWALSGFAVLQTGSPVSILSARGTLNRGARSGLNSVDTSATIDQLHDYTGLFMTGNGPYWIDPSHINPSDTRGVAADGAAPFAGQIFFNPQPGTQGSLQKRAVDGPPFRTYNMAIVKNFDLTERQRLEFHAEFYNFLNHPNFFLSDQNVNNTGFGRITTQNTSNDGVGPRLIEYGLIYRF